MESKELVVRSNSSSVDFALLQDSKLIELHKQNRLPDDLSVGDIVFATVKRVVSGLSATFVDVGDPDKEGFLHYSDLGSSIRSSMHFLEQMPSSIKDDGSISNDILSQKTLAKDGSIADILKPKQKILVKIIKEPISTKGPRLSAELSMAGRYLILVPFSDKVTVSQKITTTEESKRLKQLIKSIKPKGFGVIVRTAAIDKKVVDLDNDLSALHKKWIQMCKNLKKVSPPTKVLSEEKKAFSIIRDIFDDTFTGIHVDNETLFTQIKNYIGNIAPEKVSIVKHFNSIIPIFEKFGVERQIKSSFGRTVMMNKGAYLIIEHTEALHVIDVNSGGRSNKAKTQQGTALSVNLVAAEEIAKQLRLRDMGGIIVIDFIDMKALEDRKKLYDFFKEKMSHDRAKHRVLAPSKVGLIQMTRQRVRPEINIDTEEKNPSLFDGENIQAPILLIKRISDLLEILISGGKHKNRIILNIHPFIAAYLTKGFYSIQLKWFLTYKIWIKIIPRDAYSYLEYRFKDKKGNVLKLR